LKVENAIAPLLPHGQAKIGEIAPRLGVSRRTLTRLLASEGCSFSEILDALRLDLAKSYLREQNLPISEVAWPLGYKEGSAFDHACKRWTGKAPETNTISGDFNRLIDPGFLVYSGSAGDLPTSSNWVWTMHQ
jgi:AraC-like DNA-binding protein